MNNVTIKNPNKFRENLASKFASLFPDKKDQFNIEKSIYNYAINEARTRKVIRKWDNKNFITIYLCRFRTIYKNLNNPQLHESIKNKELSIQQLQKITHYEMDPIRWKELIDKKTIRDANQFDNQQVQASTDMFTCRKCKSKKCTYYELQTRSADEPAPIFVTCLDCGKNWRN